MVSLGGQIIFVKVRRIYELLIFAFVIIIIIYLIYSQSSSSNINNENQSARNLFDKYVKFSNKEIDSRINLAKYIHLDLKGAPPKADKFYETFFNFLEKLQIGVKGVLIEYEDTLPLQGNLINITHRAGYTKSDIKLIQESAKKHQLEIIPLVQTFGHLEWILKLNEFQSYRDDENLPTVISPCFNDTYILLEDLLQQTLDMHPNSNIIHIGCDEVSLTNSHYQCDVIDASTSKIYIDHIQRVVSIVRKIRPGIRVLIWDDILRSDQLIWNEKLFNPLKGLIEPVSWNYFPKFDQHYQSSSAWNIYPKYFTNNWVASAFKGGLHRFSIMTNTTHHVLNNRQWLQFIESSTIQKDSLSAIILTGWSRFDHFMPLCDLLPTAYPSLIYSLYILNTNQFLVDDSITNCDQLLRSIGKDSQLCELLPGLSIWSSISSLSVLIRKTQSRLKLLNTVAPEYNRKYLFVRRYELNFFLSGLRNLKQSLLSAKQVLNRHLIELYSEDVINEWFDLYLTPIENQINTTFIEFEAVSNKRTWPRRPLT